MLLFDASELALGVPARWRKVLAHVPGDHVALECADGLLTYAALDAASEALAAALLARIGPGAPGAQQLPVALLLGHNSSSLVGMLGVLLAGHFYLPLDLVQGEEALGHILSDCVPSLFVTTRAQADAARALLGKARAVPLLLLEDLPATGAPAEGVVRGQDIAQLQYTSGSTGRPKGIVRTHAMGVRSALAAHHEQHYGPNDRVAHLLSYAYAFSTTSLFGGLLNGATLCAAAVRDTAPSALYEWLASERITKLQASVGTLRSLGELASKRPALTAMRAISTGGEPMTREDVARLAALFPDDCTLTVRLASTEAGFYARFTIPIGAEWQGERTPAGLVPEGVDVTILGEDGQPLPAGEAGQIAVRHPWLSLGYWNQPELTARKYLPDPDSGDRRIFLTGDLGRFRPDGMLEHLGRMDQMVKVRGYRVELEVIEAALANHPAVRECVVVARRLPNGEAQLVAYYVARQEPGPTVSEFRQHLGSLPEYAVPSRFVALGALPRIPNGKVDRRSLPPPGRERPHLAVPYVAPRNETEARLAEIWAEVLDLDEVGAQDPFAELGGDSLSALQMMLSVEERLGQVVPPAFFQRPTLDNLARLLTAPAAPALAAESASGEATADEADDLGAPRHGLGQRIGNAVNRRGPWVAGIALPYAVGVGFQRAWVRTPALRTGFQRHGTALFERARREAGLDDPRHELLTTSLMANTWEKWRVRALAGPARFREWVQVQGSEHLDQALARGHGLVLVFLHQACATGLARTMLRAQGRAGTFTLGNIAGRAGGSAMVPTIMQRMRRAHADLARGGIVFVSGDGRMGDGGPCVPFYGHALTLRRGFAELALSTKAAVVPLFGYMTAAGRATIEFCALPTPTTGADVDNLLLAYAALLRERWPRILPTSRWGWLGYLLDLPPSS
jgi:amino acid adenylation domain-containing protein